MRTRNDWIKMVGMGVLAAAVTVACGSEEGGVTDEGASGQAGAAGGSGGSAEAGQAGGSGGSAVAGQGGAGQGGAGQGGAGQGGAGQGGAGQGGAGQGGAGQGGAGQGGAGQGGAGQGGAAGQAGGPACDQEAGEPNDIESTAVDLADSTDCDEAGKKTIEGKLAPADDDWYTWHAKDATGCVVDPTFVLKSTHNVTMCVFFKCDAGKTHVTCPSGSDETQSINGRPGCCTNGTELKPKLECTGTSSEDAYLWLHVGWKDNTECVPYKIDYHY